MSWPVWRADSYPLGPERSHDKTYWKREWKTKWFHLVFQPQPPNEPFFETYLDKYFYDRKTREYSQKGMLYDPLPVNIGGGPFHLHSRFERWLSKYRPLWWVRNKVVAIKRLSKALWKGDMGSVQCEWSLLLKGRFVPKK